MNAPQGYQPEGPISLKADSAITISPVGGGLLVKRTTTGFDLAGAGDATIGVIFDNCAIGDYVAIWPAGSARIPLIVSADGNLATIGTAVVPDTGGKVKAGANDAKSGKMITDSAANVGEIVYVLTGAC
jgi:hypothetical protein